MIYGRFLTILLSLQKQDKILENLNKNGVDLANFTDPYHVVISELLTEIYGEEGYEWFSWYCYENEYGQRDWSKGDSYRIKKDGTTELVHKDGEVRFGAYDKEGYPICYSHETLWEYLEKEYRNGK